MSQVLGQVLNKQVQQILTNPTQVEILNSLRYQKLSIGEIAHLLRLRHGQALQHVIRLRRAGLVTAHVYSRTVYYTVTDPRIAEMCNMLYRIWADEMARQPAKTAAVAARG